MRREGYELQVGQPQVIIREIDGVKCEPVEQLTVNVPEEYSSKIIDMVTRRKGDLLSMDNQGDRIHMEFSIPSRGIIGLRNNVLTARPVKRSWLIVFSNINHGKAILTAVQTDR